MLILGKLKGTIGTLVDSVMIRLHSGCSSISSKISFEAGLSAESGASVPLSPHRGIFEEPADIPSRISACPPDR